MWPEDNAGMSVCNTGAPPNFGLSNIIDGLILAAHGWGVPVWGRLKSKFYCGYELDKK